MSEDKSEERRLFVGGLSDRITDDDLKKTFSRFGSVKEVAIKRKHGDSGALEMFAFVNLDCVQNELSRCFSLLNNTKWKGSRIVVQLAKESYMDRLKREREAQQKKPSSVVTPVELPIVVKPTSKPKLNVNVVKPKIEIKSPVKLTKVPAKKVEVEPAKALSNKNKAVTVKIESETVKVKPQEDSNASILSRYASKKRACSEMKRIESQQKLVKMHQDRVHAISASLSNPDKALNKKIKFNVDSDESDSEISTKTPDKTEQTRGQGLFESSDDSDVDNEPVFRDKPQFGGKKGEKLFKLQASYNNDPRFKLNEKFASDSEDSDVIEETNKDGDLLDESRKNLGILESVLGHQVSNHDEVSGVGHISKKNQFKDFGFLRYDPKKSDAEKFIVKPNPEDEKLSSKWRRKEAPTSDDNKKGAAEEETEEVDLTDTKRYYDVSEDLSKALETSSKGADGGHFKLLADSDSEDELEDGGFIPETDDEDDVEDVDSEPTFQPVLKPTVPPPPPPPPVSTAEGGTIEGGTGTETGGASGGAPSEQKWFFYRPNDERFQIGVDFFFKNSFWSGPDGEKKWAEKRESLLRFFAARRKNALKKRSGAIVFNKNQRQHRRKPRQNGGGRKRRAK